MTLNGKVVDKLLGTEQTTQIKSRETTDISNYCNRFKTSVNITTPFKFYHHYKNVIDKSNNQIVRNS